MRQEIFVIGAGSVGGSIALALEKARQPVCGIYDADPDRAASWVRRLGLPSDRAELGALLGAQTILVAVPEEAIRQVASRAAREGLCRDDQVWLHTAGALSSDVLEPLRPFVAGVGVFHPPYAFASGAVTSVPPGLVFSTGGDEAARNRAAGLAKALGGAAATIENDDRTAYHCACVFAANYVTTLLDRACGLFASIGVEDDIARRMAAQLAESAAGQVRRRPAPEALSGPIKRGDAKTVREHLAALQDRAETQGLYRHLGRLTVELVERAEPSLSPERVLELRRVLGS